jgi:Sulfotransferase family
VMTEPTPPTPETPNAAKRRQLQNLVNRAGTERAPDFYGIGAEKCGTTWLWQMFRDHPDIGVTLPKELRYFAHQNLNTGFANFSAIQKLLQNHRKVPKGPIFLEKLATELRIAYGGDPAYLRIFGSVEGKSVGDISPQYCMLPDEGVAHMQRLSPGAKIIFLMRDPVDRVISAGKMKAGEEHEVLTDALVREKAFIPFQLEMSRYSAILDRFERYFPGQVFCAFLEDIIATPQELLQQLCVFLGVGYDPGHFGRLDLVANEGAKFSTSTDLKRDLFRELRPEYDALAKRFPERVAGWLARHEAVLA